MSDYQEEKNRLQKLYAGMADEELDQLFEAAHDLTEVAREVLQAEMERRGAKIEFLPQAVEVDEAAHPSLVTVALFRDLSEAVLARGMLQSAGIECFLADENLIRLDWFYSNAIGGMRLQVREEDAEAAEQILNVSAPQDFIFDDQQDSFEQPRCPKCGSLDIRFEGVDQATSYTSAWIGFPIPFRRDTWRCTVCEHEWKDASDSTA